MILLSIFGVSVTFVLLLPTVSDLWSILVPRPRRSIPDQPGPDEPPRLLVLVPAHDEELLVESCVHSLQDMDYPSRALELVVVADNCTDGTADLARRAGATSLERNDPSNPGKPKALAWALGRLPVGEFDAVVIIDADTVVDPDFARALGRHAPLRPRAVQAFHFMRNPDDSALTRMGAVLATAYYRFMFPVKQRGGLNVPLTGNGMCVGTGILEEHGWHAFSIAEDTELYVRLTEAGHPIEVAPDAVVRSQEARRLDQGQAQRQRWRAGRLTILGELGPRVVASRMLSLHQKLDILGELLVPGPVVHLGLASVLAGAFLALEPPLGAWTAALLLGSLVRNLVYATLAMAVQPAPVRSVGAFMFLPIYLFWRMIQEILAFRMVGRGKAWIRTERHVEDEQE